MSIHRALADRLLDEGRITKAQHDAATAVQKRNGVRIEEALLETDALSEPELLKYLASMHKTRFVSTEKLSRADIDRTTLDRVPKKLVERFNVVPVLYDAQANVLSVVTADPHNVDALDQVQKGAGVREVKALIARPAAIQAAVAKFYRGESFAFTALETKTKKDSARIDLGSGYGSGGGFDSNAPGAGIPAPDFSLGGPTLGGGPSFGGPQLGGTPRSAPPVAKRLSLPAAAAPEGSWATSDTFIETLNVLVTLIENSRQELRGHSAQVARLTRKMCERIGVAHAEQNAIVVAAYLHDLGKMSAYHLTALNTAQYDAPRAAAEKSYATPARLMSSAKLAPATIATLEGMYERHDGAGFPRQAAAKEISLGARLLAITDTYIDLTENPQNPFRKRLAPAEACEVLEKYKGSVFDPHLVDLFRATVAGDDLRARILSNRHVALLVDPDPEETTVLELRMIEEGFEVRIARTRDQARELLKKGGIEIVVSELDLAAEWGASAVQAEDGLALLVEARQNPWGAELPWLILTRRQGRDDAKRGFELGAIDYVIKPAVTEVLVAKLKKALEQRTAAAPAHGVSGSLAEMSLPDLVQILWHGRKSGALRIRRGSESGEVHFIDGRVVNAMWGKLRSDEAFYAMLAVSQGEFVLDPNFKPPEVVIKESPESLLLEGMRRLDEG
jgi:response regulator RpfG family c-di-GMP phosphodiesterase